MRLALNTFISTLNDTGSDLGVIDFDTSATIVSPLIPLSTASGSFAFFTNYANGFTGSGRTNWDDALFKAIPSGADLTLFITDGMPNEYTGQPPHTGHTGSPASGDRPLSFAVDHANAIKTGGSRMFVVGVGDAAGHRTEIRAVSGNSEGLNVAVNDFAVTSNFNALAASLRALVFSLCQSTMTVTKLVDGQPANGWDVTATITAVSGASQFVWRFPPETVTTLPSSRVVRTAGAGTATFDWVVGTEANPVPTGSVQMTINEETRSGFRFTGGTCNIDSQAGTDRDVTITALPMAIGTIPFDAIVRCTLNNQTIPVLTPVAPTVTQAQCVNGALTAPTLTLPTTPPGIAYTVSSPAPYDPGETVTVTATVTAAGSVLPTTMPPGWTRVSDTIATYLVQFADVQCTPVAPVAPTVTQAACVGGVVTAPTVTPASAPTGVTYSVAPPGPYNGSVTTAVTVTATLGAGFAWVASLPTGWTRVNATTATFGVTLTAASCAPVAPVAPTVTQAACVGGVVTAPTVTPASAPTGVTYSVAPPGPYNGSVTTAVTVTATLGAGFAWVAPLPTGWVEVNPTTATFAVTLTAASCTPATPVAPVVVQATCTNGVVTAPTITPDSTTSVAYTLAPPGPYDGSVTTAVTVTATLGAGFAWARPLPTGWVEVNPTTATFAVTLTAASCVPVAPVAPAVTQAACVGGVVTAPTVTPATAPDGVSYSVAPAGPYVGNVTTAVTVTATLGAGLAWARPLPAGWVEVNPTTATFAVTLTAASCEPVEPVAPTVSQAACVGGVVTEPTITPATGPTGVSYSVDPGGPYDGSVTTTVTVTATLGAGLAWARPLPTGWVEVNPTTATFGVTLTAASCELVAPVAPTVTQAACVAGVVTAPTITPATGSTGVSYSVDPIGPYDGSVTTTVTVTATLADGLAWADPLPADWDVVNPTTATFEVTLNAASCALVAPVAPTVVQATCTNGAVTSPMITPATTPGVSYTVAPAGPYDGNVTTTVTVTATVADGFVWTEPLPSGWTKANPTTATSAITLAAATCVQVVPAAPAVVQAVCAGGQVTAPTLMVPTTDGITYATSAAPPYAPGQTIAVTATLNAGSALPNVLPVGWNATSATTATYRVTFAAASCIPVAPVNPGVTFASCAAGGVVPASVTAATTPGVTYSVTPSQPYDPTVQTEVTVTATLTDGFAWTAGTTGPVGFARPQPAAQPLPSGWTQTSPTTATFTIILPALPDCPATGGSGAVVGDDDVATALPVTGSDLLASLAGIGTLLAGVGTVMLFIARRRSAPRRPVLH